MIGHALGAYVRESPILHSNDRNIFLPDKNVGKLLPKVSITLNWVNIKLRPNKPVPDASETSSTVLLLRGQ